MSEKDIVSAIVEVKNSDDDNDQYLEGRLREALAFCRRSAKTTIKVLVRRESSLKRMEQLHPHEDDAND